MGYKSHGGLGYNHRRKLAAVLALIGGGVSITMDGPWAIAGAIAAILVLVFTIWEFVIQPIVKRQLKKRPVTAHFTDRDSKHSLSGRNVLHDPHHINRLVVPSNWGLEIEIGIHPKLPFHAREMIVHIDGDYSSRPKIRKRAYPFVDSGYRPSSKRDHVFIGVYHAVIEREFNVGTHLVIGFRVETYRPGLYPVRISFITDDIEGEFDGLEILVEEIPQTVTQCHKRKHGRDCRVSPVQRAIMPVEIPNLQEP